MTNVPAGVNAVMDPHDELMNSVLSQVDTFRTNWILLNETLRGANNKILSLEAELSTIKNQLQYTVYEKDILNHTLNELRKTLRADCEVIDNVQKNKPSFIATTHQSSVSEYFNEQANIQRNSASLTTDEIDTAKSEYVSSFVNNPIARSNLKKVRLNSIKKIVQLPSATISTSRSSGSRVSLLSNGSNQVSLLSQTNRSPSAVLREKTSRSNLLKARSRKSIELSSNIFTRISNKYIHKVLDVNVKGEIEKKSSRSMNTIDDIFIPSDNVYVEGEDSDSTSSGCTAVSNAVHLKNEIDLSKSNESIEPTIDSKDDYQEDECHLSNSNGLTVVVGSNGHAEHENGVLTNFKEQDSLASGARVGDEQASLILNTQNLFCSDSNEQASLISTAHKQADENLPHPSAQSLISLNADKHADFIDSSDIRERVENNFPILSDPKSAAPNLEKKFPIILVSPLSVPNEISQNKNTEMRKRKNLKVVEPGKMRDLGNCGKIKKSHPSVSSVSESDSQDTNIKSKFFKGCFESLQKSTKLLVRTRSYICKICNESLSSPKYLSQHLNTIHIGDKSAFTCQICGIVTQTNSSFAQHVAKRHKKVKCVICVKENREDADYLEKSMLDLHIMDNHPNPYPDYLRCPYRNGECKEHFLTTNTFDKHVNTVHRDEDLSLPREKIFPEHDFWTCSACEKIFSHATHLLIHANQDHSGDLKIFVCELCKFTFSKLRFLQKHVKTHYVKENTKRK